MPSPLRLALAGGGTGGHVVPGVHVVQHLAREGLVGDVLWFGAGRSAEERALDALRAIPELADGSVPHEVVQLALEPQGGGAPSLARLARRAPADVLRARRSLSAHRSQALLGLGGFTSLPAVLGARLAGVPAAVFEINAVAGKATRALAPLCRRVFHAYADSAGRDARHVVTGPPLAPDFAAGPPDEAERRVRVHELGFDPDRPLLCVFGGSQGAAALNGFARSHLGTLTGGGAQVLHQVGPGRLDEAAGGSSPAGAYRAVEFVDAPARVLGAATLVLCRGGASTVAELGAARAPSVVVPYPHHGDAHQARNARRLGAGALVVPEVELGEQAAARIAALLSPAGAEERAAMAAALEGSVPLDGARRIADELLAVAGVRGHP